MPVYHQLKLVFIHVPKNAGTSLTDFLSQANGQEPDAPGHHPWHWYRDHYPNEWASYLKVAVVRNPYDRFFSCYHYARMRKSHWHSPDGSTPWPQHVDYDTLSTATADEACRLLQAGLLRHPTWASQTAYCFHQGKPVTDLLLRFERLSQDFLQLCERLGLPALELPRVNVSSRPPEDFLTPQSMQILQHVYRLDLAQLGYAFTMVDVGANETPPQQ